MDWNAAMCKSRRAWLRSDFTIRGSLVYKRSRSWSVSVSATLALAVVHAHVVARRINNLLNIRVVRVSGKAVNLRCTG